MTRFALLLLVMAVFAGCRRPAAPANALPDDLVQPYVRIQEALARDSLDGLSTNAAAVSAAARKLGPGASPLETDALKLQQAASIADARQQFGTLSEGLVAYTKSQGRALPPGIRQAWCPMAARPWLQRGSQIANPYYGKDMLNCGEFK